MLQSTSKKELLIVGGPNGAGKTTLAKEILEEKEYKYLSADDIACELNPADPLSVRLKAGKEFFRRLEAYAKQEQKLLIESTLAGKTLSGIIKKFRNELGYKISIIFIFLDSKDICIERIEARVRKGGHPVPKDDIIRRFDRSFINFWLKYRMQCNRWYLYFNAEDNVQKVAHYKKSELAVFDKKKFSNFRKVVKGYE